VLTEKGSAVGIVLAAILILVSSFLPWGYVTVGLGGADEITFDFGPFISSRVTLTAWNSHISTAHIMLPNWLIVLVGVLAAATYLLRSTAPEGKRAMLVVALASYGLLHSAFASYILNTSLNSNASYGVFLTILAFASILAILVGRRRYRQPAILKTP